MPRNLRLQLVENLDEIADTNLLLSREVQQAKPGVVSERLEESLHIEGVLCCHGSFIFALTNVVQDNIVA